MADNKFRSYRSHDPLAQGRDPVPPRGQAEDPLAELARLIGQSDPLNGFTRGSTASSNAAFEQPAAEQDWAASDGYAEQTELAQDYADEPYDEPYDPPPLVAPYPLQRAVAVPDPEYDAADYDLPAVARRPGQSAVGAREDARGRAVEPRYRDEPAPSANYGQQQPAFLTRPRDDRYEYDDEEQDIADNQSAEDYEDDIPNAHRRGGLAVIATVMALAVLGTAGAFAYRAMFGSSFLPSLPPIIKADNGPNKIVPSASSTKSMDQADANGANSAEKLVPRQENPVDVPAPVSTAPRVVATIPIFPAPDPPPPGVLATGQSGYPAPVTSPTTSPGHVNPALPPIAAPMSGTAMASAAPSTASAEPKKIHTVAIRPDQLGGSGTSAAPDAAAPPMPTPVRAAPPRPAAAPAARAAALTAPSTGANAPLSIVPSQAEAPISPPARARIASAQPTSLNPATDSRTAPAVGGGYAVQITSQRSEAEAQTAFRALRAKYPAQLGGHEPMVRRADLGTKGVYYRALVGPFASVEAAAGMCSSLKAAGGNCIVQKN